MPTRFLTRTAGGIRRFYGANPLHLLALLGCVALAAYVVVTLGITQLWNTEVWWQSLIVWFVGAAIAHDLVLFPLYALADRSVTGVLGAVRGRRGGTPSPQPQVSALNYLRVPVLATGLLFVLFFPGIIEQGKGTYLAATGQTQAPFLGRWLLLTAVIFGVSAVAYAIRLGVSRASNRRSY